MTQVVAPALETEVKEREATSVRKVLMGDYAAAYGAMLSRVQVVAAYPITPQTSIIEKLAEFCATGQLNARYLTVESEQSSLMAVNGASATGARAFTTTSSQGLALMHEALHWSSGMRLPVVMVNCNRGLGAPWTLHNDHTDSMAQRDTGWMQLYCESNQEVLDTVIQAYRIAERVKLPLMLNLDGFYLTHTSEPVEIPSQRMVDEYLPARQAGIKLDLDDPRMFGGGAAPAEYYQLRYKIQEAMEEAKDVIAEVDNEFKQKFGRGYGMVESYRADDADVVLLAAGTAASTARTVVDRYRQQGKAVGLLKLRAFRPFPMEDLREIVHQDQKIAVVDRAISFGQGGILYEELKSAFYYAPRKPRLFGFVTGLGGVDTTPGILSAMVEYTYKHDFPPSEIIWTGANVKGS